ncbi:MAG: hypothetical protein ABI740_02540 [Alphaproteobacteria bacterium]
MAQSHIDEVSPQGAPTGPSLRPTGEKARQGQNIRGMLGVLIVGTLLVVLAFGVMLALRSEPYSVTNSGKDAAAAATSDAYPSTPDASQTPTPATNQ